MKRTTRFLALILMLCLLCGSFSSCAILFKLEQGSVEVITTPIKPSSDPFKPSPDDTGENGDNGDNGGDGPQEDELTYTLTQADLDACSALMQECERMALEAGSADALTQKLLELDDLYAHISTQEQLAYIYYCLDLNDQAASDRYLFASAAAADLYSEYMEMCRRVDNADIAPNRETFFADWTEAELAMMRKYHPEQTELEKKNDTILVNFRNLSDDQIMDQAPSYYLQLLKNNNSIAQMNGYENYWEYAYVELYERDYGKAELEVLRATLAQEVPALMELLIAALERELSAFTQKEYANIVSLLYDDCEGELLYNLLQPYLKTFPEHASDVMLGMFDRENSFYTDSENAYAGAFTGYWAEGDRPFCYFGPEYQSLMTHVHELGHYYAATTYGGLDIPLDLAETHSQGNEWMLMQYLDTRLDEKIYNALLINQMIEALATVYRCVVIDHFEQLCYEENPQSKQQIEDVMNRVVAMYGGRDVVNQCAGDIDLYWRYVVIESPVYYISYAVSGLAAMQFLWQPQTLYLELLEYEYPEESFLNVLYALELEDPFSQECFSMIKQIAQGICAS